MNPIVSSFFSPTISIVLNKMIEVVIARYNTLTTEDRASIKELASELNSLIEKPSSSYSDPLGKGTHLWMEINRITPVINKLLLNIKDKKLREQFEAFKLVIDKQRNVDDPFEVDQLEESKKIEYLIIDLFGFIKKY